MSADAMAPCDVTTNEPRDMTLDEDLRRAFETGLRVRAPFGAEMPPKFGRLRNKPPNEDSGAGCSSSRESEESGNSCRVSPNGV